MRFSKIFSAAFCTLAACHAARRHLGGDQPGRHDIGADVMRRAEARDHLRQRNQARPWTRHNARCAGRHTGR